MKIGDRVRIKGTPVGGYYTVGAEGTIIRLTAADVLIAFDKGDFDQACSGEWYVLKYEIEVINEEEH